MALENLKPEDLKNPVVESVFIQLLEEQADEVGKKLEEEPELKVKFDNFVNLALQFATIQKERYTKAEKEKETILKDAWSYQYNAVQAIVQNPIFYRVLLSTMAFSTGDDVVTESKVIPTGDKLIDEKNKHFYDSCIKLLLGELEIDGKMYLNPPIAEPVGKKGWKMKKEPLDCFTTLIAFLISGGSFGYKEKEEKQENKIKEQPPEAEPEEVEDE